MSDARGAVPAVVHSVARSLAVDRTTAEVVSALDAAGVRSILLKGPALARWLYDDGAVRPYVDCDLLVSPEAVDTAEGSLRALGFERVALDTIPGDWPRHARAWTRAGSPSVDMHLTLPGVEVPADEVWRCVADTTERMTVGGADVEVLSIPGRALMLALHAAKDGTRSEKSLHDLGHGIDRASRETWEGAARLAERLRAQAAFATGLRKVPEGRRLAAELGLSRASSVPAVLRDRGAPPLAMGIDWFVTHRGERRRKVVLVLRKLVPPPSYLRAWRPVARRGSLGLAVAYVWRPCWVAWRTPPALLAYWRARRETGRLAAAGATRDDGAAVR